MDQLAVASNAAQNSPDYDWSQSPTPTQGEGDEDSNDSKSDASKSSTKRPRTNRYQNSSQAALSVSRPGWMRAPLCSSNQRGSG